MSFFVLIILSIIVGYLFGSIPFALIIGKLFCKVDVRNYGSHNLGTTNVARTLGPKVALIVLILDASKSAISSLIMFNIAKNTLDNPLFVGIIFCLTGFMAAIGHCFPIFAKFRGGKAVATIFGFLLISNYRIGLLGLAIWLIIIFYKRIVSLASIIASFLVAILIFIPFFNAPYPFLSNYLLANYFIYPLTIVLLASLLIIRHISNIKRLINHEEKVFHFGNIKNLNKDDIQK